MDSRGWTILLDVYLAFIVAYVKRLIHDKIGATNNQLVPKYGIEVLKDDHTRSDSNIWTDKPLPGRPLEHQYTNVHPDTSRQDHHPPSRSV